MQATLSVPECTVPAGWVIASPSNTLDAWSTSPLVLRAPEFSYPEHSVSFSLTETTTDRGRRGGLRSLLERKAAPMAAKPSRILFDARFDATDNVAHILQNHVAVVLSGLEALGMGDRAADVDILVHEATPAYALALYATLGFATVPTGAAASGAVLAMTPPKFPRRALAAGVLRKRALALGLLRDGEAPRDPVFLSRRKRRTLFNVTEIERMLASAGYRTVYVEDLPTEEQIRTVALSRRIVGLHGAALGFLMLREPGTAGIVAEAFSDGYASNWARANCAAVGTTWVGIQGTMKVSPQPIRRSPREFEAENYQLDPSSVGVLVKLLAEPCVPEVDTLKALDELTKVTVRTPG